MKKNNRKRAKSYTMTRFQEPVFDLIVATWVGEGRSPTLREMAKKLKKGVTTIHSHVEQLRYKGYLHYNRYAHDGIIPVGLKITYEEPSDETRRSLQRVIAFESEISEGNQSDCETG